MSSDVSIKEIGRAVLLLTAALEFQNLCHAAIEPFHGCRDLASVLVRAGTLGEATLVGVVVLGMVATVVGAAIVNEVVAALRPRPPATE